MPIFSQGKVLENTIGNVLSEREMNGYDDSDFYATIWLPEQGKAIEIQWGTTRFASIGHGDNCVVDATPQVVAQYTAWLDRNRRKLAAQSAAAALTRVDVVGNTVRVVKGRKVPKGFTGVVIGRRERIDHVSRYGTWTSKSIQLLIMGEGASWETNANNCELVKPGDKVIATAFDLAEAA